MKTMQHGRQSLDKSSGLAFTFPGKQSFLSFLRKVSLFLLFSFFVSPSFSNNIRITGTVKVSESSSHSDTLLLSFSLCWDHSWRDEFNWDAAWMFLKYKTASGAWQPVYLSPGGHRFTDASGSVLPFGSMEGETDGKTVGVFIYRTTFESGNTPEIRCHLLCPRSSLGGLPAEAFQRNEAFLLAQGIEMVYIPYGAYYAGDSSSFHTIADAGGHPILVDSEESVSLSAGGSSYTLSSSYPKGYKGFYVMKYEVSQEQYVTFLNNLTYTQQQERVPGLASFSKGDYIFGDASRPSCRNGIIVAVPSEGGRAVIFANNLNNDAKYSQSDDGKTLACNYLSPEDMIAYLSWSGLRPMSELEYEKACRPPYPEMPLEKEYAWHENSGFTFLASVSNGGSGSERSNTTGANVNAGNRFSGPVRCGLFATGSSSQRDAGASFWGVMEMSGNLRELCYNVSAANAFSGDVYGDGTYKRVNWSTVVSHFGVRGGGFSSVDSLLRVSDRSEAESYFTSLTQRDSTVGFRGVRPITDIDINIPELKVYTGNATEHCTYACTNLASTIIAPTPQVALSHMTFTYLWHIYDPNENQWKVIPGESDTVLHYSSFTNLTTSTLNYKFRRTAICAIGSSTSEISIAVPNTEFRLTTDTVFVSLGNAASSLITAKATQTNGAYEWWYKGSKLSDLYNIDYQINPDNVSAPRVPVPAGTSLYRANRELLDPSNSTTGAWHIVIPRYTIPAGNGSCERKDTVSVWLDPYNPDPCWGKTTAPVNDAGGTCAVYAIGKQCWMGANANFGTFKIVQKNDAATGNFYLFDKPGLQKWCNGAAVGAMDQYVNNEARCDIYGGLYEWWEAVCNGYCNTPELTAATVSSISITQGTYTSPEEALKARIPGVKMAANTGNYEHRRFVQGICPDGWHIPTDEDWKQLEITHGMSRAMADRKFIPTGKNELEWGRMTNAEGYKMKSKTGWYSSNENGSNLLGFNGLAGGDLGGIGHGFYCIGTQAFWWSSSMEGNRIWTRYLTGGYRSVYRGLNGCALGYSIRCIHN